MGRKRIPEEELKKRISIRLKNSTVEEIKKYGTLQKMIESIVEEWLRNKS